jgi:hypothetical protein
MKYLQWAVLIMSQNSCLPHLKRPHQNNKGKTATGILQFSPGLE